MIGLPFLPNYIDGQFKVKTRLTPYDELTVMALAGVDRMELNTDLAGEDEGSDYILSYLPKIEQETFTVGASYRHYAGRHVQTYVLSHNYLNDKNLKYRNNDESTEGESHASIAFHRAEDHVPCREYDDVVGWLDVERGCGIELHGLYRP